MHSRCCCFHRALQTPVGSPDCGFLAVKHYSVFNIVSLFPCLELLLQVLACIGEQFDEGDEVCGVTVNIRQGEKE